MKNNLATHVICMDNLGSRSNRNIVTQLKRPGFPEEEPKSLYHRDSSWISSSHIENLFQLDITDIQHWKSLHGFNNYIIQRIVIRNSEYKPLGLKTNKQESEAVASLLGILRLDVSTPQEKKSSVAQTVLSFTHPCKAWSSSRILHLSIYPQGRDRFTSLSVCKL